MGDRLQDIVRGADAHKVAWFVGRQDRASHVEHIEHHLLRLTDGEAAYRIALEVELVERRRRAFTQLGDIAALNDAKHRLARLVAEGDLAALGPAQRHLHAAIDAGITLLDTGDFYGMIRSLSISVDQH